MLTTGQQAPGRQAPGRQATRTTAAWTPHHNTQYRGITVFSGRTQTRESSLFKQYERTQSTCTQSKAEQIRETVGSLCTTVKV